LLGEQTKKGHHARQRVGPDANRHGDPSVSHLEVAIDHEERWVVAIA